MKMNNHRIIRFLKVYSIFNGGIYDESTKNLSDHYEIYIDIYQEESNNPKQEFDQMKEFILAKKWNTYAKR